MSEANYIRTFTGKKFYPLDPNPADVDILDVAHHLSLAARWAGATRVFYSVALHSLHVSSMCRKEDALAGLMHDAAEFALCDLPKPVKLGLPEYNAHEDRLMKVIAAALGFDYPLSDGVHQADATALYLESKAFFQFSRGEIPEAEPPRQSNWHFPIVCSATPAQVEGWFIDEYYRLKLL